MKTLICVAALLLGSPLSLMAVAVPDAGSYAAPVTYSAAAGLSPGAATVEGPGDFSPARDRDFHKRHARPSPAALDPWKWSQQGLEYRFSLGALKPANGQALSYMPLEVGWRFANGWRLRAGLELFYYTGLDQDKYTADNSLGAQQFYYQMQDVRLSALYEWPLRSHWRPLAGITIDTVYGSRQFSYTYSNANPTPPNPAPPVEPAYSFEALGAEAGVEYRGGPHWSLSLEARYSLGAGYWASLAGTDFGWHYLF